MPANIHTQDDEITLKFEITAILQQEIGLHEQYALTLAEPIVAGLVKRFGGQRFYIAKKHTKSQIAIRDAQIKKEFNGANLKHVMQKFCLSKSAIYKICHKNNPPFAY
ncbi:MAG: Mor transcription activator family protein [Hydrogenophaga sp.]|nr:Mor transcription activator family protein [Hydrogenophaga sp.]